MGLLWVHYLPWKVAWLGRAYIAREISVLPEDMDIWLPAGLCELCV